MLRIVIGVILGFAVAALAGRALIPFLRRMKAGQSIKEIGPTWHMSKQGTPTMGGLMFIIAAAVAVAVLGWPDFVVNRRFGGGFVLLFALVFGIIGYIDDYMKVKHHQNTGLTAPQKFLLQLAAAILFTVLMRGHGYLSPVLYLPFINLNLALPWPVYMVFAAFVMVGTVNAVNITDGIDGLAAGVTAVIALMHDVLIAFCVFVIFGLDVDDVFIAVILTILGYSLNATIVVYDRVRENRRKLGPKVGYDEILNLSMNQTLSRTVLTSLCTFLALVVVFIVALIFNIDTVVSFALPMMAGVAAGCFSSQFIAPNLFGMWQIHKRNKLDAAKRKA